MSTMEFIYENSHLKITKTLNTPARLRQLRSWIILSSDLRKSLKPEMLVHSVPQTKVP